MWRVLTGEQLKIGDAKLEELFSMLEVLMKDLGNPKAVISMNYPWLFKFVNNIGITKIIFYYGSLMNLAGSALTNHKNRHSDGMDSFFIFIF